MICGARFVGQVSYIEGTLFINAQSKEQIQINGHVSMKSLTLTASLNMISHEVLGASIDGEVAVTLGFDDSTTGTVAISLRDGTMTLDASLVISKAVQCSDAFVLTGGSFELGLVREGSSKDTALSLTTSATAKITYNENSAPLTLAMKGTYDSVSTEISLEGSSEPMIPSVFGLDVLSVGKLGIAWVRFLI